VGIIGDGAECTRISIFLNIFDVHVNRAPIAGKITNIEYTKGQFLVASREIASSQNERNTFTIAGAIAGESTCVRFAQIAGLIARRIVCYKKPGDSVAKGERVGLIKFGSRVDVVLGPEWDIQVQTGERVAGGSSILARRRST
jgi:phosphatidylserine decarboxylase